MNDKPIIASFSGGKTSAYMTWRLKQDHPDLVVVFANTGQEHEETLRFVHECDQRWGLNIVWIEANVHFDERKSCTHKIVSFETASRCGAPFERVIKKYGISNKSYPHCTRELKINPIKSYASEMFDDYYMAIGIRVDEIDRMQHDAVEKNIIYPLVSCYPSDKSLVGRFWSAQNFTLELPEILGNCVWCWKKSTRKHLTLVKDSPEYYDFPDRMERKYPDAGAGTGDRVFFRSNQSVNDLKLLAESDFKPWVEHHQTDMFNEWDTPDGCSESCEIEL